MEFENKEVWWYDKFYEKLYNDSNITKFNLGRKLFNKRAITYLNIDKNEADALVFDGKKAYYDASVSFSLINYSELEILERIFRDNTHFALELINGVFSPELYRLMKDSNINIFPSWNDVTHKCSCKKVKKCEHVSAVLHRIFNEVIFEPLLLFNLRGLDTSVLFSIFMNDPDFTLSEILPPKEMTIDHYRVKSSAFDTSEIDPARYYGVEIPDADVSGIRSSELTESKVFHGKIREEFYDIYESMTDIIKTNIKKY